MSAFPESGRSRSTARTPLVSRFTVFANDVIESNDFLNRTMDTHFIQAVYRCPNIPLISFGFDRCYIPNELGEV
jgi:hypothetical protein